MERCCSQVIRGGSPHQIPAHNENWIIRHISNIVNIIWGKLNTARLLSYFHAADCHNSKYLIPFLASIHQMTNFSTLHKNSITRLETLHNHICLHSVFAPHHLQHCTVSLYPASGWGLRIQFLWAVKSWPCIGRQKAGVRLLVLMERWSKQRGLISLNL